jgi:hypothetical protein
MPRYTHYEETVSIDDVKAIRSTQMALLVRIGGKKEEGGMEVWIPQSQIDGNSEVWKEGDEGELVISQWIAEQKGLV